MYTIISSSNEVTLASSFPIYIPLVPLCCLIALAKTRTALNRHGESGGQPCLFPDFSGIVLSFSPFKLMLEHPSLCPVSLCMLCTYFH